MPLTTFYLCERCTENLPPSAIILCLIDLLQYKGEMGHFLYRNFHYEAPRLLSRLEFEFFFEGYRNTLLKDKVASVWKYLIKYLGTRELLEIQAWVCQRYALNPLNFVGLMQPALMFHLASSAFHSGSYLISYLL